MTDPGVLGSVGDGAAHGDLGLVADQLTQHGRQQRGLARPHRACHHHQLPLQNLSFQAPQHWLLACSGF